MPATVTVLGVTPARSRVRATGSTTRVIPARADTWKIFAMAVPTITVRRYGRYGRSYRPADGVVSDR
ncbi:hypothetical protein GCM10017556_45990 [Micromonospora sagamiensis]|nr:hypothetical protein GCM10017556_45990 [Micromonospora sagamiensis]